MPKYEVLKSYDIVEVHIVEADNEDEAIKKAWESVDPVRTYDGYYHDTVGVSEIKESDDA